MLDVWPHTLILAVDSLYEKAEKRTYLLMLTVVGMLLPLLVGLLLLYPWIQERIKEKLQDQENDSEHTELIPQHQMNCIQDSDD